MSSNIPRARRDLELMAKRLNVMAVDIAHITEALHNIIEDDLKRAAPGGKAPAKSVTMTAEIGDNIRQMKSENPKLSQGDLAMLFRVNTGRVSEALNGEWTND